jgi:5-methylcytosine-specific restriction enzyme A
MGALSVSVASRSLTSRLPKANRARQGKSGPGTAGSGLVWLGLAWRGVVGHGKARGFMPKKRQPKEVWDETRRRVLARDGNQCRRCSTPVFEDTAHIDHIVSGKRGTNELTNLRALCRRCHTLRADNRHRGMVAKALADGIIPPNWRELVWEG